MILDIVCDLPVPGGPCIAVFFPSITSTIALNCDASELLIKIGTFFESSFLSTS